MQRLLVALSSTRRRNLAKVVNYVMNARRALLAAVSAQVLPLGFQHQMHVDGDQKSTCRVAKNQD